MCKIRQCSYSEQRVKKMKREDVEDKDKHKTRDKDERLRQLVGEIKKEKGQI